ncbi:hypothetical protein Pla52o_10080 [Novipirellula galeiformis]|uniref:Uncharacterized protein n=1 Tax=Novipirellula galeiformis TaxID=2528004 RepID=A0A5C6CU24_9BACT|nr:hypothetical protein [Novipirellula galeiformis]TWU27144.1 hypothetical protein Pla52o_10080 [Novipirellula galeiformis]
MGKRDDLLRQLKKADRRRGRRTSSTAASNDSGRQSPGASDAADQVDVTALIVSDVLAFAHSEKGCRDPQVVSALRSLLRGSDPTVPVARGLRDQIQLIADRPDVNLRDFRSSVKGLLEQAAQFDREAGNDDRFLNYLAVLIE